MSKRFNKRSQRKKTKRSIKRRGRSKRRILKTRKRKSRVKKLTRVGRRNNKRRSYRGRKLKGGAEPEPEGATAEDKMAGDGDPVVARWDAGESPPWEERVSRTTGDKYYYNPETQESTYERALSWERVEPEMEPPDGTEGKKRKGKGNKSGDGRQAAQVEITDKDRAPDDFMTEVRLERVEAAREYLLSIEADDILTKANNLVRARGEVVNVAKEALEKELAWGAKNIPNMTEEEQAEMRKMDAAAQKAVDDTTAAYDDAKAKYEAIKNEVREGKSLADRADAIHQNKLNYNVATRDMAKRLAEFEAARAAA